MAGRTSRFKFNVKPKSRFSVNKGTEHVYGSDWAATSQYVKRRDNYTCQAHKVGLPQCYNRFPPPYHHLLHAHHVIKRSRGGKDIPQNLVTLCNECHGLTHDKYLGKISNKQKAAARRLCV